MNQFFIGIIIVLGLGGYWLYQENVTLKANNLALEGAIATQQEALETMTNDFALQTSQLNLSLIHISEPTRPERIG